jgi:hypothetical protein
MQYVLGAMVANGIQPGVDGSAIGFTEKADLDSAPVAPTYLSMNREEAAKEIVQLALAAVDRTVAQPGTVHLVSPSFVDGHSLMGSGPR